LSGRKSTRPKSLAISTPTKLLSLEEARLKAMVASSAERQQVYLDVGGGPANLPPVYHTIIDLPKGFVWLHYWTLTVSEAVVKIVYLLSGYYSCDSVSIRLWFGFDLTTTIAIKIMIRLRFDSSKWALCQYVNEGMNSYQMAFYFVSAWKGYTNVDDRRMLPDVDPSAWMPFLLQWRALLCHYIPANCLLIEYNASMWRKKWTCSFFVVVESKPNRSQIAVES